MFKVAGARLEMFCYVLDVGSSLYVSIWWACYLPPRGRVERQHNQSKREEEEELAVDQPPGSVQQAQGASPPTLSTVHTDVFDVGTISQSCTYRGRPAPNGIPPPVTTLPCLNMRFGNKNIQGMLFHNSKDLDIAFSTAHLGEGFKLLNVDHFTIRLNQDTPYSDLLTCAGD